MQQILRVQASAKILQNQTSKWIIYRSFRLNKLSMNLSAHDKLRSVSTDGHVTGIKSRVFTHINFFSKLVIISDTGGFGNFGGMTRVDFWKTHPGYLPEMDEFSSKQDRSWPGKNG